MKTTGVSCETKFGLLVFFGTPYSPRLCDNSPIISPAAITSRALLNLLLLLLSRPASTLRCCSSVLPPPWRLPPSLHLRAKGSLVLLEVLRVGADNLNLTSRASTSDRRTEISLESSNNCPSEQMFPPLSSGSCL